MAQKRFEDAIKKLEEIVQGLEKGELSLEDSLKFFEEGMKLLNFCSDKLDEAEKKVQLLVKESDIKYSKQPFDIKEGDETE